MYDDSLCVSGRMTHNATRIRNEGATQEEQLGKNLNVCAKKQQVTRQMVNICGKKIFL